MPLDFAASLLDTASNLGVGISNYKNQESAVEEQKRLNDFNMDWTKNKYYYTSQDLARTGLSKAALLNQAPSNAAVLSAANAPHLDFKSSFRGLYSNYLNNRNLIAENKLIEASAKKAESETRYIDVKKIHEQFKIFNTEADTALKHAKSDEVRSVIERIKKDVEVMSYNLEHSQDHNIRTTDAINGLYNTLNAAGSGLFEYKDLIFKAIDVAMLVLPGAAIFKSAKLLPKFPLFLKTAKDKGIPWIRNNFDKFLKKVGLSKKDIPSPSDFFG